MDILSIGEILIDLTQTGVNAEGVPLYAANPGGAPANLSVAASRLGARTTFIGKVGDDAFGRYLTDVLKKDGVDVSALAVDAIHPTSLAVVSVDANGERSFTFYRRSHADTMLMEEEIQDFLLRKAHMVHFGSVSVVSPVSNILCLWIVSAVYIGGYMLVALGALLPGAAVPAAGVLAWSVRYIYAVSGFLSRLPCANVYVRNPLFLGWLVLVYVIFFAAWLCSRKTGRFRALAPVGLSLALLFAAAGITRLGWSDSLRLTALDVGQGECIVLTSGGHAAVVDCGGS